MIAGVLLAAGGARRFGAQKLVAPLHGKPVVRHAAQTLSGVTDACIVVVGSAADEVRTALASLDLSIVENAHWIDGLGGSLARGIAALGDDAEAAVIAMGDQPSIDPGVIQAVIACWRETGKPIVSARYRGIGGHPVLFARALFPALCELHGDAGARLLIERSARSVAYVDVDAPMPRDVDTPDDLRALGS